MSEVVSIIVPVFNSANTVERTIKSLIDQSYTKTEIIVVDDCSTDKSCAIVESIDDERVTLIKLTKNQGVGIARNYGLSKSTGRYIAFCDSDDVWKIDKLEKQIDFMILNNCSASFSSYIVAKDHVKHKIPVFANVNYRMLLLNNWIGCSTVMIDKNKLGKLEFSSMRKRQDWLLWLQIARNGISFQGIKEPLVEYNVEKNSLSSNKMSLLKENYRIYNHGLSYTIGFSLVFLTLFLMIYGLKKVYYDLYNWKCWIRRF